MGQLEGKTAIITGASAGIGRAAAKIFAAEGASLVIGARREDKLEALADEIAAEGGRAVALAGDIRNEAYAKALCGAALSAFGALDIALNNAATMGAVKNAAEITESEWRDTLDVNLTGAFFCAKHQAPLMLRRGAGSIIFTSSYVGYTAAFPGMAAYCTSKAGMIGLAKALAAEFGPQGVRVNALLPGGTDTEMGRSYASTPEALDFVRNIHALKRLAHPEEIARAALFLASDASAFVTGTALLADGGASINHS